MSVLTTKERKNLSPSTFGAPPTSDTPGRFPMPDRAHAANAKARLSNAKGLTSAQRKHIIAKADTILGRGK